MINPKLKERWGILTHKLSIDFRDGDEIDLDEIQMESFVKNGIKKPYISPKPKKQQLYFLYKLIMNRKKFQFNFTDRVLHRLDKVLCCFRKKLIEKRCSRKFAEAKRQQ